MRARQPTRSDLAALLAEAAELEQSLVCQYLYAFFSLKRSTDEGVTWQQLELMRRWGASLLLVARQEMEHVGLVCNLLTAIGEAPYLQRPEFPLGRRRSGIGVACKLEPFGEPSLSRFIRFEAPVAPAGDQLLTQLGVSNSPSAGIAELYVQIGELFAGLASADLFVGPPGAQLNTTMVIPVPIRGVQTSNHPVYDIFLQPATDLASAQAVIAQIVEEGEGTPTPSTTSHFTRFCTMLTELQSAQQADPSFVPARAVVSDPGAPNAVSVPSSAAVCALFDAAYGTTLLLLQRFFAQADESVADIAALQKAVFFPMMTGVIRPLGEICTMLPAHEGSHERAAPAFACPPRLGLLPHRRAAWKVIGEGLGDLARTAGTLAADTADYASEIIARLGLVAQNLSRVAADFDASMKITP